MGYLFSCNNQDSKIIAESNDGMIYFERVYNYTFQEAHYIVAGILDDEIFKTFEIDSSEGWETERKAYQKAALYFNSLVSEKEAFPAF